MNAAHLRAAGSGRRGEMGNGGGDAETWQISASESCRGHRCIYATEAASNHLESSPLSEVAGNLKPAWAAHTAACRPQ